MNRKITVGVLALQGAFFEHIRLLKDASVDLKCHQTVLWEFIEVRTPSELALCDALIIPGGESTTVSLVAERSNLLEPLREFVKASRKPVWGTCAGLILLAESANRTKKGGQELIGGLDVRVQRNYFGRQIDSFEAALHLPFLSEDGESKAEEPYRGIFIRAPVVEKSLTPLKGEQVEEAVGDGFVMALPSRKEQGSNNQHKQVEIMARIPSRGKRQTETPVAGVPTEETGDIVAVLQDNVFGTSFHPELTNDTRIHRWWLKRVSEMAAR